MLSNTVKKSALTVAGLAALALGGAAVQADRGRGGRGPGGHGRHGGPGPGGGETALTGDTKQQVEDAVLATPRRRTSRT